MISVAVEFSVRPQSPLHIASGLESPGIADRIVVRDARGLPYVPGSSIKGALRETTTRISGAIGLPPCKGAACAMARCMICGLFGSVASPCRLRYGNARISDGLAAAEFDPIWFEVRNGVQICRRRRIAQEHHLYVLEYADPPSDQSFSGRIAGWVGDANVLDMQIPPTLWALLCGMRATNRLGGNRSRGAGSVSISIDRIEVGGAELDAQAAAAELSSASRASDYLYALREEVAGEVA